MLQSELDNTFFDVVQEHLRRLKFDGGELISAELGKGNKGRGYVLRKPWPDNRPWLERILARSPGYTFELPPRDEAGSQALGQLANRGANLVANALTQSVDHVLSFFHALLAELAFYIGCLNLHERLVELGEPTCVPDPLELEESALSASNLYDVCLALRMKHKVVPNDVDADGRELLVITGANQGGKSTFLRSVGVAQLLMQAGMFVPAERFSAKVCSGVFTHYKREEDASMQSGKFDEELARMSSIVDQIRPGALMLFNESFASTNEREGSEVGRQIVRALLDANVRVVYVTHMYELADSFRRQAVARPLFLRAEREPDGRRTFRLAKGDPLSTSYGPDLYKEIFEGATAAATRGQRVDDRPRGGVRLATG
jgi:DNA mismatch repair ATPase MutS